MFPTTLSSNVFRRAELIHNQNQLMECFNILKEQYDEKKLVTRLLRLVTKMVLAQMYDDWNRRLQINRAQGR